MAKKAKAVAGKFSELADKMLASVKGLKDVVKGKAKPTVVTLLPVVLAAVEGQSEVSQMSGDEKKELALTICGKLLKTVSSDSNETTGLIIDSAVNLLNVFLGKKWGKTIPLK